MPEGRVYARRCKDLVRQMDGNQPRIWCLAYSSLFFSLYLAVSSCSTSDSHDAILRWCCSHTKQVNRQTSKNKIKFNWRMTMASVPRKGAIVPVRQGYWLPCNIAWYSLTFVLLPVFTPILCPLPNLSLLPSFFSSFHFSHSSTVFQHPNSLHHQPHFLDISPLHHYSTTKYSAAHSLPLNQLQDDTSPTIPSRRRCRMPCCLSGQGRSTLQSTR